MNQLRLREAEVLDVLLGGASPELAKRVQEDAASDLALGALYTRWADTLEAIQEPVTEAGESVVAFSARIHNLLADEMPAIEDYSEPLPKRLQGNRRVFRVALGAAACILIVIAVGLLASIGYTRITMPLVAEAVSGRVIAEPVDGKGVSRVVVAGERFRLPVRIRFEEGAQASFRFSGGDRMRSTGVVSEVEIKASRLMRQEAGTLTYRVEHDTRAAAFVVETPQGRVVDLGTEFDVTVTEPRATVVRVKAGRVRVEPQQGQSVETKEGEQTILTTTQAITESKAVPSADNQSKPEAPTKAKPDATPQATRISYQPTEKTLETDDPIRSLMRFKTVSLATGKLPAEFAPPPNTDAFHSGKLDGFVDGHSVSVPVLTVERPNGKLQLYLDANLNGDFRDDPPLTEGVDFKPGKPFEVGVMGRHNTFWLQMPVTVDTAVTPPVVHHVMDRLQYTNRTYLSGKVTFPNTGAETSPTPLTYQVLDTDSDGDYLDEDGSVGVWSGQLEGKEQPIILAAAPPYKPAAFMGQRWQLTRELSGDYSLTGQPMNNKEAQKALRPGGTWKPREVTTLDGKTITLAPPEKGYLLVYVWSTWFSGCQRDVPFEFNDLFPKFKDRGLSMVGISTDFNRNDLEMYLQTHPTAIPQVFNGPDIGDGVTGELGVNQSPMAILVDATGRIVSTGESADSLWSFFETNLPK